MDPSKHAAQFIRDLTHDLSTDLAPRAAEASKRSARTRVHRLRSRVYFILQCSVSAGVSWWVAQHLWNHKMPYLAPVAAIVCLGLTFGQRWRRVLEVTVGVATGVFIGSAFAHYFGSGPWQIIVVAAAGMVLASLLGGGALISTQAAVQGTIVVTLVGHAETGFDRWLDALVGAVIALIAATITPASPIDAPRDIARRIARSMADVLRAAVVAHRDGDLDAAAQALYAARESEADLASFATATNEGMAVVRHSPLRRRRRGSVEEIAAIAAPIDRAVRNIRVLVRRISTAIWRHDPVSDEVLATVEDLAEVIDRMAELDEDERLSEWRARLAELGDRTSALHMSSLSSAVLIAQLRSIIVDLLEVTGLTYEQARDRLTAYEDE
ncbi:FUSC family protein [Cumulibacter manganitolerans]|uniref:FUSC family protein n=1 Tax=Cumulibacter manganitolerans TaxID=1884992 RepID=UPI001885EFD7|nr:FUSC family protein [Cumulibacter manganitolerans]